MESHGPVVLVLAPGRDGELSCRILGQAGFDCHRCASEHELFERLDADTGVLLIAEELLTETLVASLAAFVAAQPPWSDLPLLVVAQSSGQGAKLPAFTVLGNVSLLPRPMSPDSLVSTVRLALRARLRQFEVRNLVGQLQEQARRKDQFLAMLAHELRNPLAPVRYAAHLLRLGGEDTTRVADIAQRLERQVGHMGRIIDQLLDVTRITRGLIQLDRRPLDLAQVVRQTVDSMRPLGDSKGVAVSAAAPAALWVQGDETRLKQALDNLVDNALKFCPRGASVRVEAEARDGRAVLRVADDGDGIDPSVLPVLFEAFTQADRSLDRSRGGLGLGLALVKGLVELHGGSVAAASDGPGRGSVFTISLPLAAARPAAADGGEAAARDDLEQGGATGRPLSVLVAEDNVDAAETLQLLLELHGYQVALAHNGPAAVEAAARLAPDAVVCDIGLPGLSGYEVARQIRAAGGRRTLLIAVTGYGTSEDQAEALAAGFDLHLAKPVAPGELLEQLRQWAPA